jgi:hypothetical protein
VGGLYQHVKERLATSSPQQFQIAGAKVGIMHKRKKERKLHQLSFFLHC